MTKSLAPLRRVVQRDFDAGDCGIACVAMLTGRPYEDVLSVFRRLPGKATTARLYTSHKDLQQILTTFNIKTYKERFKSWAHLTGHVIVKVNVKNDNTWHWIVRDGGRSRPVAHDPKPGKRRLIIQFRGLKGSGYVLRVDA